MSKLLKSLVATFMIFALGAPAIASASDSLEGTAVKVSFADLNIEKAAGAKALYHRLQSAAKEACGVESLKNEGSADPARIDKAQFTQSQCHCLNRYSKILHQAARVRLSLLSCW